MKTSAAEPMRISDLMTQNGSPEQAANCEKHGEYTQKIIHVAFGKSIRTQCPKCQTERADEEKRRDLAQKQQAKERAIAELFGKAGIPPRFQERTFANYRAETEGQKKALAVAKRYAESFEDRLRMGGGLVFCGKPGTGKTHLAASVANYVMSALGRAVLFTTVLRAVRRVKETYSSRSEDSEADVLKALCAPDLLILDEVGVQFGTETEKLIMFEILNGRYEQMKPTILLSNLTEPELVDYIGARSLDRLREGGGVVVAFDWDSYRQNVHKDKDLPVNEVRPVSFMQ